MVTPAGGLWPPPSYEGRKLGMQKTAMSAFEATQICPYIPVHAGALREVPGHIAGHPRHSGALRPRDGGFFGGVFHG